MAARTPQLSSDVSDPIGKGRGLHRETISALEGRKLLARKPLRRKYGNAHVEMDGVEHASKKQGLRWVKLRQDERDGKIRNLRREVAYRIVVNGQLICGYVADHVYEEPCGARWREVVEDVKSEITRKNRAYRIKVKLMRAVLGIEVREA